MKLLRLQGPCSVFSAVLAALLCQGVLGIVLSKAPSQAAAAAGAAAPDFDHLRRSVVRIQALSAGFDWLRPFAPEQDGVGLGSGFVVQAEPYPLFATNAHVISDAKTVSLQLLLFGAEHWDAEVVSVCSKFDLALIVLREPGAFKEALASRGIALEPLKLSERVASMGEDVVALGFPLGQDALKISKGNVAGNEDVDGNICIQSTAPISPGNSGGPLLDALGKEVVGVNFAKATEGENINYVIPVWRVAQMVAKHLKDQPKSPADGAWKRMQVHVPSPELTTIVPNRPLYEASGGCERGIYIAKIGKRSSWRRASPPIQEGSFLVAVNGQELDRFGTGLNEQYVADRVAFTDLFFMVPDISAEIKVQACFKGNTSTHAVSMAWTPDSERGISYVDEPYIADMASKYEMFGDIAIMQMTVNHISAVLSTYGDPGPARWMHPDLVAEPRLVINFVQSGSYASSIFPTGSAVSKVNGQDVRTLDDFRSHFEPTNGSNTWSLETDMGELMVLSFNDSVAQQIQSATAMHAPHLLTSAVVRAAKNMGIHGADSAEMVASADSAAAGPLASLQAAAASAGAPAQSSAKAVAHPSLAGVASSPAKPATTLAAAAHLPVAGAAGALSVKASGPVLVRRMGEGRRGVISTANTLGANMKPASSPNVVPVAWHLPLA